MPEGAPGNAAREALGVGAPFANAAQYERALAFVEQVFDEVAADPAHPLGGLIDLRVGRIRKHEGSVHPWPNTRRAAWRAIS